MGERIEIFVNDDIYLLQQDMNRFLRREKGTVRNIQHTFDFASKNHYMTLVYVPKPVKSGWQPITEYDRTKHGEVLIKYFDGDEECVPQVAKMLDDGKWYIHTDYEGNIPLPENLNVKYFFDLQNLD